MRQDYELISSRGNLIRVSTYFPENYEYAKCIIFVHGFKGFKDWGFAPYLCQKLSENNYFTIAFNFSHNGIGTDLNSFTELEKFANNTISLEIEELGEIIDFYLNGSFGFVPINRRIGVIGVSRGGAVSIIRSAEDSRISALATWASIAFWNRYTKRQVESWKKLGYLEVINTRTNQVMRLNKILLEDFEKNKERFDLTKRISELNIPILIVHGTQDMTVTLSEANTLYANSNKEKSELFIIENTNHTFGAVHPFTGTNPKLELAIDKTLSFFNRNL